MVGQEGPALGESGPRTAPRSPRIHHTLHRIACKQKGEKDLKKPQLSLPFGHGPFGPCRQQPVPVSQPSNWLVREASERRGGDRVPIAPVRGGSFAVPGR